MYIGKVLSASLRRVCKMYMGVYTLAVLGMIGTILGSSRPPPREWNGTQIGFSESQIEAPGRGGKYRIAWILKSMLKDLPEV